MYDNENKKNEKEKENVLAFGYIGKVTCIKCSSMISKSECLFSSGMPDFHTPEMQTM